MWCSGGYLFGGIQAGPADLWWTTDCCCCWRVGGCSVETRAQLLVFQTVDQGVNLRAKDGQPGERNAEHRHAVSQFLQDEGSVQL